MRISIDTLLNSRKDAPYRLRISKRIYEGYPLRFLLDQSKDWETAEMEGAEGCSVILSREEVYESDVWLVREDGWRLVISGDPYHRRWCRGIHHITLDEGEGF